MSKEETHGEDAPLARNASVDAVVAALLTIAGMVVMYEAYRLGASWASDGPGSGYFPFYVGALLCIGGIGILYQSLLSKNADQKVFVTREQFKRVQSVLLPTAVYVGAIMLLGQYVASAVFVALFMVWLGKYSPLKSVLLGVAVSVFFFILFEVWFKVPLYKGAFDLLGFTGY
jgi:hypothetical protein